MLVTGPAGKGPSGRMRAEEQSRTEHGYPAKLWVCRHGCVIDTALCACAPPDLLLCPCVHPPLLLYVSRLVAYFVCRCMLTLACFVSRFKHVHVNL